MCMNEWKKKGKKEKGREKGRERGREGRRQGGREEGRFTRYLADFSINCINLLFPLWLIKEH